MLLFIKSYVQLDTSNLKFKLHTISAVKFSMLIKRIFCFCILFLCVLDASGNSLELTLAEYAEKPFGNVIFLRHALAPGFDANGLIVRSDNGGILKLEKNFDSNYPSPIELIEEIQKN